MVSEAKFLVGNFTYMKLRQILKFHERVISTLILVASFAKPKFSSQFLRVNGILKFAKIFFRDLKFCFIKMETRGLEFYFAGSQLRGRYEKSSPYLSFKSTKITRTSEVARKGANAPHAIKNSGKF